MSFFFVYYEGVVGSLRLVWRVFLDICLRWILFEKSYYHLTLFLLLNEAVCPCGMLSARGYSLRPALPEVQMIACSCVMMNLWVPSKR